MRASNVLAARKRRLVSLVTVDVQFIIYPSITATSRFGFLPVNHRFSFVSKLNGERSVWVAENHLKRFQNQNFQKNVPLVRKRCLGTLPSDFPIQTVTCPPLHILVSRSWMFHRPCSLGKLFRSKLDSEKEVYGVSSNCCFGKTLKGFKLWSST